MLADMVRQDEGLTYSVSATTRNMRDGEAEGVNYYYKTPEEFERLIKEGDVLEWDSYQGNKYGTLVSCLDKSLAGEKNIVLDITVPGAVNVKRSYDGRAVSVFILPPSIEELRDRLIERKRENIGEIDRRICFAIHNELSEYEKFDYVIINDDRKRSGLTCCFAILRTELLKQSIKAGDLSGQELNSSQKEDMKIADALKTAKHPGILEEKLHISYFFNKYKVD